MSERSDHKEAGCITQWAVLYEDDTIVQEFGASEVSIPQSIINWPEVKEIWAVSIDTRDENPIPLARISLNGRPHVYGHRQFGQIGAGGLSWIPEQMIDFVGYEENGLRYLTHIFQDGHQEEVIEKIPTN